MLLIIRSSHWCGFAPRTGHEFICETSHVLLAGVSGGFSLGTPVFAPPTDWFVSIWVKKLESVKLNPKKKKKRSTPDLIMYNKTYMFWVCNRNRCFCNITSNLKTVQVYWSSDDMSEALANLSLLTLEADHLSSTVKYLERLAMEADWSITISMFLRIPFINIPIVLWFIVPSAII